MANLGKSGKTSIYIDLSVARSGVYKSITGKYVKVVASSDATARINLSVGENVDTDFQELRRNGAISDGDGFSGVYISNDAQAGKWVRIIITKGKEDYDVENPSLGIVEGIVDDVAIVNAEGDKLDVFDETAHGKLDAILAMMQNPNSQRTGMTDLTGAVAANVINATTVLVSAAANVNGIIIRVLSLSSNGGQRAAVQVGSGWLIDCISNSGDSAHIVEKDIFIPAGKELTGVSGGVSGYVKIHYEVLP